MKYKIVQFFKMLSYNFKSIDIKFLEKFLTQSEIYLIEKLKKSELHHSILVAKDVKQDLNKNFDNLSNKNYQDYIKAALLHDIGKIEHPINIFEKSIATIINKIYKDKETPIDKLKFYKSYLLHGAIGNHILRKIKTFKDNEELYDVIKHHHLSLDKFIKLKNYNPDTIKFFEILKFNDDKN